MSRQKQRSKRATLRPVTTTATKSAPVWKWLLSVVGMAMIACVLVGCQVKPSPISMNRVERATGAENLEIWPERFQRARVFLFVRTDCPIANRYAPEIKALHDQFRDDAEFVLVYCSPQETMSQIETHVAEFYTQPIPALRDAEHALVELTAVSVTPEAVVYSRDKRVLYRGRIDDRYVDFGVTRAQPTKRELHDVLRAIQENTHIAFHETKAVGCPISR